MATHADQKPGRRDGAQAARRDGTARKMNSVGAAGERYVQAVVYQDLRTVRVVQSLVSALRVAANEFKVAGRADLALQGWAYALTDEYAQRTGAELLRLSGAKGRRT